MGLLSRLIRAVAADKALDTGVVLTLLLNGHAHWSAAEGAWPGVAALEDVIRERLLETELGQLDRHEVTPDRTELRIFACGPNPEALFEALYPLIVARGLAAQGSYALLRYGAHGAPTKIML
jgi:hypothetical protein